MIESLLEWSQQQNRNIIKIQKEQLHPQNVCGSLPRGVHNNTTFT